MLSDDGLNRAIAAESARLSDEDDYEAEVERVLSGDSEFIPPEDILPVLLDTEASEEIVNTIIGRLIAGKPIDGLADRLRDETEKIMMTEDRRRWRKAYDRWLDSQADAARERYEERIMEEHLMDERMFG